ncbi:MAG: DUF547 domain-containing protein [Nitrospirae bacterium]|nr:DUF547 domain-containing protein [Nitrospirota bacterium]
MNRSMNIGLVVFIISVMSAMANASPFDGEQYQRLLNNYVQEGKTISGITISAVDYAGLHQESTSSSSDYAFILRQLSSFNPETISSHLDRIAFWINAYNIGAVKMILDHYPVDSIRSTKINLLKNPWKKNVLNIGGREYSLDEIEHGILMGTFRARMAHYAIVCASLSCPDMRKEVYVGARLKEQLEDQARRFLSNTKKGILIDTKNNTVYFSQIFKFDSKTFPEGALSAVDIISPFLKADERRYIDTQKYTVNYFDYLWELNGLK